MKKRKESSLYKKNTKFYHTELNPDGIDGKTYWLITEVKDNLPIRTYYYEIPEQYKMNVLLEEMYERYCQYCPN
jgi:hypothetical protein